MPILALHGFTGRGADFAPFARLCGGNWHCPDLPGHGPQRQLDCSPEATVRQVTAAATRLPRPTAPTQDSDQSAAAPKILLGYSMGARAALLHAVRHPDIWDALILISANPGIEDEAERATRRESDEALAQRIERDGLSAFLDFWQAQPLIRNQKNIRTDWYETMQANRASHSPAGLATSLRQFGQGSCPNLWPELAALKMPILLLTGEEDTKYTAIAQRMCASLPRHVSSVTLPRVFHMPHLEAPEASLQAIQNFLNTHASGDGD